MLTNKQKTSKNNKKINKNNIDSDKSIQSFRSWIRKLEQTTNSLSGRLTAVEKRLSKKNTIGSDSTKIENKSDRPIGKIIQALKEEKDIENIEEISNVLDDEFLSLQDEIIQQQTEIAMMNEKIKEISDLLAKFSDEIKDDVVCNTTTFVDFEDRLEKIERKEPPTVKLGKMEIPIEVTGIIGGIFAFIIAIFVAFGQNEVVLSPLFLFLLGIVLIVSALFKTFNIGQLFSKSFKKSNAVHAKLNDTQ